MFLLSCQEVEPVLQALVGKILEQAMLEVMQDEERANLQKHQEHYNTAMKKVACTKFTQNYMVGMFDEVLDKTKTVNEVRTAIETDILPALLSDCSQMANF